jgi:hypothetical protein
LTSENSPVSKKSDSNPKSGKSVVKIKETYNSNEYSAPA